MQIDIDSKTGTRVLKLLKSEQSAIEKSGEVLKLFALNSPVGEKKTLAENAEKAIAAFLKS